MSDFPAAGKPPIDPAGFQLLWERLSAPPRLLLAVSGGSDSMALMRLAAPLNASGKAVISVATVDHGLRESSRGEALFVAKHASELGLSHEILPWLGAKPKTAIQEAARHARYCLLIEHAIDRRASVIMTAHTAEDQAETVLMRAARGSGPRGLAGMADDSLVAAGPSEPIRLVRPLLGVRREALRAFLQAAALSYIDDPSNEDPTFERVRARRALSELERVGVLHVEALAQTATEMRASSNTLGAMEFARFAALGGRFDPLGAVSLDRPDLSHGDISLVARLIYAVGGGQYPPNSAATATALGGAFERKGSSLGGALIRVGTRLVICREPAGVLGRSGRIGVASAPISPGESILWDRRFIVRNNHDRSADVRPMGAEGAKRVADEEDAQAASAAPALWIDDRLVESPWGGGASFRSLAEERFFRSVNRFDRNYVFVKNAGGAALL